jgi:hypothetical protein
VGSPPARSRAREPLAGDESEASRRRNWLALALGTIAVCFSYFPYAAAFIPPEGQEGPVLDAGLVGLAVALAPFAFVVVGFVSRNPRAPKQVLAAMGLLLVLGLGVGLIAPVLGASAGFGVGIALVLNRPGLPDVMRNRILAVVLALVYIFALLVFITPAGVLSGALIPPMMVGFADEYTAWASARRREG